MHDGADGFAHVADVPVIVVVVQTLVVYVFLQVVYLVVYLVDSYLGRVLLAGQHAELHSLVRDGLRGRHHELVEGLLFMRQVSRGVLDVLFQRDVAAGSGGPTAALR